MPLWTRRSAREAEGLLRAGRFAQAEQAYARCVEERPREARSHLALGHLALLRDDLPSAEDHLRAALSSDGTCPEAHELLAYSLYRRDAFGPAAESFEAAGFGAMAEKLRSFESRRPYALSGPAVVRVPFVRRDPLPIVRARVDGGDEVPFLIDTGGAELILDGDFARRIGAPLFGTQKGEFGGGKQGDLGHGAVGSVALGELTLDHVPVQTLDLRAAGAALGEPRLAGILGTIPFYRLRATLDYPGSRLVLRRKDAPPGPDERSGIEIPFWLAADHYIVAEGTFNGGPPLLFFVDTGLGGGAFTCPPSTLRAAGIDLRKAPRHSGPGGGGSFEVRVFEVASLTLGAARREGLLGMAGAFPSGLEWAYGFRIGGLVSHEFFLPYAVTFDFAKRVIRLSGPGAP